MIDLLDEGTVLHTESVDLVREGRYILTDVTMTVRSGEHWVLIGPNGAGKSTLLSLLGAFEHPTHGTVDVLGKRLGRVDMRELRSYIGHVNPRHNPQSPLTVREVVLTGLTNTAEIVPRWQPTEDDETHAAALIASLGMETKSNYRWPTLSQGERGRALIARALMPKPRVVLLDEPATGLDLAAREQLLTALDDLRREHPRLASILVTHHIEEIPSSTTHGMLLRDGQILATGPVADVLTTDLVSKCFDHPIDITRRGGRWSAVTR